MKTSSSSSTTTTTTIKTTITIAAITKLKPTRNESLNA